MATLESKQLGYKTSVIIKANQRSVFEGLTKHIDSWWGKTDRPVSGLSDEFTVSWGEPWYRFKVIDFKPDEKISWECIDSRQIISGLQGVEKEWVGTKQHWDVKRMDAETVEVSFYHEGLVPDFICYDVCSRTWGSYIATHLKSFLEKN
ncbi:MAG: hypothetical protein ACRBF0_22490 [Calditrichia bacterium]